MQVSISGLDSVRLLAAFQVLALPDGMLGATHAAALAMVEELTGRAYDARKERRPPSAAELSAWLSWHGEA